MHDFDNRELYCPQHSCYFYNCKKANFSKKIPDKFLRLLKKIGCFG